MDLFIEFLKQGFLHILDINGLDHLLFLTVIGVVYTLKQWKELLWVLSTFTIAHSLTLTLALFDVFSLDSALVEFLIPLTILFTCLENLYLSKSNKYRILFSGIFGLIHGMGFSTLLKNLFLGMNYNPWQTLLPFNLGIEFAQILIIAILLSVLQIFSKYKIVSQPIIVRYSSIVIGIIAIIWSVQRYPF